MELASLIINYTVLNVPLTRDVLNVSGSKCLEQIHVLWIPVYRTTRNAVGTRRGQVYIRGSSVIVCLHGDPAQSRTIKSHLKTLFLVLVFVILVPDGWFG